MINSLDVFSIATNGYDKYYLDLLKSAEKYVVTPTKPVFHLFTDNTSNIESQVREFKNIRVCLHTIPSYEWPEATLVRYQLIYQNGEHFKNQVLMYIDSDMLFKNIFGPELNPDMWKSGLAFVSHPGFWREEIGFDLQSIKDLYLRFKSGGLGTWESRPISMAFVSRNMRKVYACGGIWLGLKEEIIIFAKEMFQNVEIDKQRGITAIWHDESHLNKYISEHSTTILTPEYCFDPVYLYLKKIEPRIEAVRKIDLTTRSKVLKK